jgi:DNA-dependent RNA polymerase auxiliary subunit epsilon
MLELHKNKEALSFTGRSMYLKIHDERQIQKQLKENAFNQSLFVASK